MKNRIKKYRISIIIAAAGALAGFLYWYYIGCASGNCGITANWYTSIAYGSVLGWLIGDIAKKKNKPADHEE